MESEGVKNGRKWDSDSGADRARPLGGREDLSATWSELGIDPSSSRDFNDRPAILMAAE